MTSSYMDMKRCAYVESPYLFALVLWLAAAAGTTVAAITFVVIATVRILATPALIFLESIKYSPLVKVDTAVNCHLLLQALPALST